MQPSEPSTRSGTALDMMQATATETLGGSQAATVWRRKCYEVMNSFTFEMAVAVLVLFSFISVIIEADLEGEVPAWLTITNGAILAFYAAEVAVGLFVFRWRFFYSVFNVMDLAVVVFDTISQIMQAVSESSFPSVAALRIFRMLKLARGFKVIVNFPTLALMIKGVVSAVSAAFYGMCLLFVVVTVWSVCAVQFIHPVNQRVSLSGAYGDCARCHLAFSNVRNSMLTFVQQIIAGDSWGQVTIPIIEEAPSTAWFFAIVFVSIHFTIINVILAVIVDNALKASQADLQEIVRQKSERFKFVAKRLKAMCKDIDLDMSGDLTLEELLFGYESIPEFREHLMAMDIQREDMSTVFTILDADESGSVSYEEFINELIKMKTHDSHTMLVFIKHYVTDIRKDVRKHIRGVKADIIQQIERTNTKSLDEMGSSLSEPKWQDDRRTAPNAESFKDLGEELRSLRRVISDDLVRSMKELSQKSETHRRLFSAAPVAGFVPFDGDGGSSGAGRALREAPEREGCLRPFAVEGEPLQLGCRAGDADPARPRHAVSPAVGGSGHRPLISHSPPSPPSSAWAIRNCCSTQRSVPDPALTIHLSGGRQS